MKKLAEVTGFPCVPAEDLIEATSDCGAYVMVHGALKRPAVKMSKICNDLRLLFWSTCRPERDQPAGTAGRLFHHAS